MLFSTLNFWILLSLSSILSFSRHNSCNNYTRGCSDITSTTTPGVVQTQLLQQLYQGLLFKHNSCNNYTRGCCSNTTQLLQQLHQGLLFKHNSCNNYTRGCSNTTLATTTSGVVRQLYSGKSDYVLYRHDHWTTNREHSQSRFFYIIIMYTYTCRSMC